MYMVSATVDSDSAEGNITRVFSIPVIVNLLPAGTPDAAPAPPAAPQGN